MVNRDLKKARNMLENIRKNYSCKIKDFERIYPFSNENLRGCLNYYDFDNKKCLTVLGSSDQTLDMCLLGAKDITTFDSNPLTKYYFDLKKAALLAGISKDEYLKFFCYRNYSDTGDSNRFVFNPETFAKLVPYLSKDGNVFWTTLFNEYPIKQIRNMKSLFYFWDEEGKKVLQDTINYLYGNNYDILREKIKDLDFSFIKSGIKSLQSKLSTSFDFIYLSNIIQYANSIYGDDVINHKGQTILSQEQRKECLIHFKKLMEKMKPLLNKEGNMVIGYLYTPFRDNEMIEVFKEPEYYYLYFNSMLSYDERYYIDIKDSKDGCLVYYKKR